MCVYLGEKLLCGKSINSFQSNVFKVILGAVYPFYEICLFLENKTISWKKLCFTIKLNSVAFYFWARMVPPKLP